MIMLLTMSLLSTRKWVGNRSSKTHFKESSLTKRFAKTVLIGEQEYLFIKMQNFFYFETHIGEVWPFWYFPLQIRAWRNIHGFEPRSDVLSKLRDLFGPVCQRRGAGGQQRLLLWEMQGEGVYSAPHMLLFNLTDIMRIYDVCICSSAQRTTVKRTCIKSLPSVLCIHLMRFGFDWESGRSIKYDEQIRVRSLKSHVTKMLCLKQLKSQK